MSVINLAMAVILSLLLGEGVRDSLYGVIHKKRGFQVLGVIELFMFAYGVRLAKRKGGKR